MEKIILFNINEKKKEASLLGEYVGRIYISVSIHTIGSQGPTKPPPNLRWNKQAQDHPFL